MCWRGLRRFSFTTATFATGKADEHLDKHVPGLDDAGRATRTPDTPEYDIADLDKGVDKYVAKSIL